MPTQSSEVPARRIGVCPHPGEIERPDSAVEATLRLPGVPTLEGDPGVQEFGKRPC